MKRRQFLFSALVLAAGCRSGPQMMTVTLGVTGML